MFEWMCSTRDGSLPVYKQVLAGASAGMCQIVITTPMELLKIALQDSGRVGKCTWLLLSALHAVRLSCICVCTCVITKATIQSGGAAAKQAAAPTATQIAFAVFKQKGFLGFYQGGTATLVRDVTFSAIYFPLFAFFNQKVSSSRSDDWMQCICALVIYACCKC